MFSKKRLLAAVFLLALLASFFFLKKTNILNAEDIIVFLKNYPVLAPFLFVFIYVFMIVLLIPTLPMNLGVGFLWGGFFGGIMALIAVSLGAAISFFISRYLFHDYFNRKFNNQFWQWLKTRMQKHDWKIVVFTRVNPAFPFALTSYFFGLTPISFLKFILSTVLPVAFPAFLFAYLGHSIGGIILGEETNQILRKIFIISALFVFMLIFYIAVKNYFKIKNENNTFGSDVK